VRQCEDRPADGILISLSCIAFTRCCLIVSYNLVSKLLLSPLFLRLIVAFVIVSCVRLALCESLISLSDP